MTAITDEHVEWAVVSRLRLMIEEPPHGRFNVTQSFSLCASILCWVMQRVREHDRPGLPASASPVDRAAFDLLGAWKVTRVSATPWGGAFAGVERVVRAGVVLPPSEGFERHDVARVLINLRDACAHGDKKNVAPLNRGQELIGFTFRCTDPRRHPGWTGIVTLVESDLRAIGAWVARAYCDGLRRTEEHRRDTGFGRDAAGIREAAA